MLLSVCGAQTYKLIRNLLAPQTPEAVEYDDIVKRVQDHVRPKPSVIQKRFRFNSLNRKEGESVADFVTELRRLSTDCAFGDTLSDMLRDRLVCGINEEKIQRRLLQEEDFQESEKKLETAMNAVHIVGRGNKVKSLKVAVVISQQKVEMEIDTGAAVTLVNEATFKALWSKRKAPGLRRPQVQLRTYSGESLNLVGETDVKVRYGQQVASLPLIIVKGKGPNLFGRNWMQNLKLKWEEIFHLHTTGRTSHEEGRIQHKELITKYQEVFKEKIGLLEGATASIAVRADTAPRFFKPRPVPYAYKELVEQELRRLERDKIIEAVRFSDWAAPVVPVLKKDGSIRICGDSTLTINQAAPCEKYPLPKINDIFASLSGGQLFNKLDLSQAYQQVVLDETSQKYVVINTHLGLFKYKRLPLGWPRVQPFFKG